MSRAPPPGTLRASPPAPIGSSGRRGGRRGPKAPAAIEPVGERGSASVVPSNPNSRRAASEARLGKDGTDGRHRHRHRRLEGQLDVHVLAGRARPSPSPATAPASRSSPPAWRRSLPRWSRSRRPAASRASSRRGLPEPACRRRRQSGPDQCLSKALKQRAKTDPIDADVIAKFARATRPRIPTAAGRGDAAVCRSRRQAASSSRDDGYPLGFADSASPREAGRGGHPTACGCFTTNGVRMVTSSSAAVGWTAMVRSKSALVAPMVTAMPTSWIISPAPWPMMWTPSTLSVGVDDELHQHALVAARQRRLHGAEARSCRSSTSPQRAAPSASVRPMTPISGVENTAVGISAWSTIVGLPPNTVSAKAWPSRIATGVRLARFGDVADGVDRGRRASANSRRPGSRRPRRPSIAGGSSPRPRGVRPAAGGDEHLVDDEHRRRRTASPRARRRGLLDAARPSRPSASVDAALGIGLGRGVARTSSSKPRRSLSPR